MADKLTVERRSWNMSKIRSKDTTIETKVRQWLFHHGYRYRKNVKGMPGKPDIFLGSYNTVVFVHGCFWHRHPGCIEAAVPKTRTAFWLEKFEKNISNDKKNIQTLESMGYQVIVLWECEIEKHFEETMDKVVSVIGPPHKGKKNREDGSKE